MYPNATVTPQGIITISTSDKAGCNLNVASDNSILNYTININAYSPYTTTTMTMWNCAPNASCTGPANYSINPIQITGIVSTVVQN
jgi:hypothetical protein